MSASRVFSSLPEHATTLLDAFCSSCKLHVLNKDLQNRTTTYQLFINIYIVRRSQSPESSNQSTAPHRHNEIVAKQRCGFTQFSPRETCVFLFQLNAFVTAKLYILNQLGNGKALYIYIYGRPDILHLLDFIAVK